MMLVNGCISLVLCYYLCLMHSGYKTLLLLVCLDDTFIVMGLQDTFVVGGSKRHARK